VIIQNNFEILDVEKTIGKTISFVFSLLLITKRISHIFHHTITVCDIIYTETEYYFLI